MRPKLVNFRSPTADQFSVAVDKSAVGGLSVPSARMYVTSGHGWGDATMTTMPTTRCDQEYTYDELCEAVEAKAATRPPEAWRDGFHVNDYIIEATLVGIIATVECE
jgi:hypothetical protein